jgi:hypothetical protein
LSTDEEIGLDVAASQLTRRQAGRTPRSFLVQPRIAGASFFAGSFVPAGR